MARDRRATFGPVVLLGLASAALAAVASAKEWVSHDLGGGAGASPELVGSSIGTAPLASALSLVLLAAWGVLLVTRGRVRRGMAVLALLVALGLLAVVVSAGVNLPGDVRDVYSSVPNTGAALTTSYTGWFWITAVTGLVALVATVLAVRLTPAWPEMGTRYDAPGSTAPVEPGDADTDNLQLWKSLDEGADPTADRQP